MEHASGWTLARIGKTVLTLVAATIGAAVLMNSSCKMTNKAPTVPVITGPSSGVVGVAVTFKATATDPDNDSIAFQFDWGDTSTQTWSNFIASGETTSVSHTYSDSGQFSIKVKARDGGRKESGWSQATSISLVDAGSAYPDSLVGQTRVSVGVSSVMLSSDERSLYIAAAQDFFVVVDMATGQEVKQLPVGASPIELVNSPSGTYVYVSNWTSGTVSVIKTSDWSVVATVPVAVTARDLAVTLDGSRVYVSCPSSNRHYVIRTADNLVIDSLALDAPGGIVMGADSVSVYVLRDSGLVRLRLPDNVVTGQVALPRSAFVAASPTRGELYIATTSGVTRVVELPDMVVRDSLVLPEQPLYAATVPGGYVAFLGMHGVHYVHCGSRKYVGTASLGTVVQCRGLTATADGSTMFVGGPHSVYVLERRR